MHTILEYLYLKVVRVSQLLNYKFKIELEDWHVSLMGLVTSIFKNICFASFGKYHEFDSQIFLYLILNIPRDKSCLPLLKTVTPSQNIFGNIILADQGVTKFF